MKRLLHILLNVTTLLSFLLLLGAVAGWVRSQWVTDWVEYYNMTRAVDDLRARRFVLCGTRGSLFLKAEAHRIVPLHADQAGALYRELQSITGFSHERWGPSQVAAYVKVAPYWGFTLRTSGSADDPQGINSIHRARGIDFYFHHHEACAAIPWWTMALVFGVAPVRVVWRRWRSRAIGRGLCRVCGYDLRATPDRCPECGAVPSKPR